MSARTDLEVLVAARDRLQQLRDDSTPGPWSLSDKKGQVWVRDAEGDLLFRVALGTDESDADLIVTLRRTVDAQIAILETALGSPRPSARYGQPSYDTNALALARAVLGDTEEVDRG